MDSRRRTPLRHRPALRGGPRTPPAVRLTLLGGFELELGGRGQRVPPHVERLVAFVALHDLPLRRSYVSGRLWLEGSQEQAFGSLRTTLWRVRRIPAPVVEATSTHLALAPSVAVDARARRDRRAGASSPRSARRRRRRAARRGARAAPGLVRRLGLDRARAARPDSRARARSYLRAARRRRSIPGGDDDGARGGQDGPVARERAAAPDQHLPPRRKPGRGGPAARRLPRAAEAGRRPRPVDPDARARAPARRCLGPRR